MLIKATNEILQASSAMPFLEVKILASSSTFPDVQWYSHCEFHRLWVLIHRLAMLHTMITASLAVLTKHCDESNEFAGEMKECLWYDEKEEKVTSGHLLKEEFLNFQPVL